MLFLRTLGSVSIQRGDSFSEVAAPRRTLALLALLAASDNGAMSRDRIAALLWPESDEEAARNSLRQTLYRLKQSTGVPVVVGNTELRLDRETITSDVATFREAIARGKHHDAIAAYSGPFLDGFFRRGADEFERWAEHVRQSLAAQHRRALVTLADIAAAAGNVSEEIDFRRQLCHVDATDPQSAANYMSALARAGNTAEALRHFAVYERALQVDLGVTPSGAIVTLAEALRQSTHAANGSHTSALAEVAANATTTKAALSPSAPRRGVRRTSRRHLSLHTSAVVLAVLAFASLLLARPARVSAIAADGPVHVDIRPAEPNGEMASTERTLVAMIAARLDGVGGIEMMPDSVPIASSIVGAKIALYLRAVKQGGTIRLLIDTRNGELANATALDVPGDSAAIVALADAAAYRLLPSLVRSSLQAATRRAARNTTSLHALKLFVAAEAKVHEAHFPEAMQILDSAVTIDAHFAYAFHRLAEVADWNGRVSEMLAAARKTTPLLAKASDDDRLLISSVAAWRLGDIDGAERGLRKLVTDYPTDFEGWYFLGEVQFHSAPLRGRDFTRARHAFEQVVRGGTRRRDVTLHLARIAMKLGDRAAAESITWLGVADSIRNASHDTQPYQLLDTSAVAIARLEQKLRATNSASFLWEVVDRGSVYSENVHAAARIARLLATPPWSAETRRGALLYAAALEAARGRFEVADSMLANSEFAPHDFIFFRAVLGTSPYSTLSTAKLRMLYDSLQTWHPHLPQNADADLNALAPRYRNPFLSAVSHKLGVAAHFPNDRIARDSNPDLLALDRAYAGWSQAQSLMSRGDAAAALRALEATEPQVTLGSIKSLLGTYAPIRWLRAELLQATGRLREAQQWYDAIVSTTALETPYLAPAHLRSAEILEQLGERESAAMHYRAVLTIWRDADTALQPIVSSIRTRLAAR